MASSRRRSLAAEIAFGCTPEGRRETARVHADGDASCGRDWLTGGCTCGACRIARAEALGQNAPVAKGHGGKREGAGRKTVVPDGVPMMIRLPAEIATRYVIAAAKLGSQAAALVREIAILHAPPE